MKIKHKVHKKNNLFPFELVWVVTSKSPPWYSAQVTLADRRSMIIKDEDELWLTKRFVENNSYFLYWVTDWEELERQLDES